MRLKSPGLSAYEYTRGEKSQLAIGILPMLYSIPEKRKYKEDQKIVRYICCSIHRQYPKKIKVTKT